MDVRTPSSANIDEYIQAFPPEIQSILQSIRTAIRKVAPEAKEIISYKMPAFRQNGILVYFAAFNKHIGIFPPVSGDSAIEKAIAPYAGPKGNLKFPLNQPIPYDLIERIVMLRIKQDIAKLTRVNRNRS